MPCKHVLILQVFTIYKNVNSYREDCKYMRVYVRANSDVDFEKQLEDLADGYILSVIDADTEHYINDASTAAVTAYNRFVREIRDGEFDDESYPGVADWARQHKNAVKNIFEDVAECYNWDEVVESEYDDED